MQLTYLELWDVIEEFGYLADDQLTDVVDAIRAAQDMKNGRI